MNNEKRVLFLTIATGLSLAYAAYVFYIYFTSMSQFSGFVGGIAGSIVSFLVAPHLIVLFIGVVFNILGFIKLNTNFILTSAILYSVACVLFFSWGIYLIPGMICMYIAFAQQKQANNNI